MARPPGVQGCLQYLLGLLPVRDGRKHDLAGAQPLLKPSLICCMRPRPDWG